MDKQQKTGENVEMVSTCSPIFCCLSARGLEVSLHSWQSWPTVRHTLGQNSKFCLKSLNLGHMISFLHNDT